MSPLNVKVYRNSSWWRGLHPGRWLFFQDIHTLGQSIDDTITNPLVSNHRIPPYKAYTTIVGVAENDHDVKCFPGIGVDAVLLVVLHSRFCCTKTPQTETATFSPTAKLKPPVGERCASIGLKVPWKRLRRKPVIFEPWSLLVKHQKRYTSDWKFYGRYAR